jgi:polar amino acid transport system substrate-binding protein
MKATTTIITSAVVAAVISIIASVVFRGPGPTAPSTDEILSEIESRGTLRAAYVVGAPLFMIDANTGAKSGIFHDIVTTAAGRLGLKVNWVAETGYGQMPQDLDGPNRKYDIAGSGVWINSDRAKVADFSIPLFYDAVYAYVRPADAKRYATTSAINSPNVTISTMDGELGATIAQSSFPKAKTLALPQNSAFAQLILNVIDRKADVVFLARGAAADYQSVHPGDIVAVDPSKPLRIFPNALMLPQGQYVLKNSIDAVLSEMENDGTVDAILKRYEKSPNALLRPALPYQAATGQ